MSSCTAQMAAPLERPWFVYIGGDIGGEVYWKAECLWAAEPSELVGKAWAEVSIL